MSIVDGNTLLPDGNQYSPVHDFHESCLWRTHRPWEALLLGNTIDVLCSRGLRVGGTLFCAVVCTKHGMMSEEVICALMLGLVRTRQMTYCKNTRDTETDRELL